MTRFPLPWLQDHALGAEGMNDEHRGVLDKLNRFMAAVPAGNATHVLMSFSTLMAETRAHFASEEAQMQDLQYPDFEQHREQHERLLRGLTELQFTLSNAGNLASSPAPFTYLERWFAAHLANDDKKLADFLAARVTGPDAAG